MFTERACRERGRAGEGGEGVGPGEADFLGILRRRFQCEGQDSHDSHLEGKGVSSAPTKCGKLALKTMLGFLVSIYDIALTLLLSLFSW